MKVATGEEHAIPLVFSLCLCIENCSFLGFGRGKVAQVLSYVAKDMSKVKFFICLCISLFTFCFLSPNTKAADIYSVIYTNVSYYNGDAAQCDWITNAILYASGTYQVDPYLITAVMQCESGYNFNAYSPVGAIGLMQLMPDTAASLGVDPYDPLGNVLGGASYLRILLDDFGGWGDYGVTDAVAAYNAGPNAVYKYGGVPPYSETRNYVISVNNAYQNLLNLSY
ncbi:lytic transglycosylase domain-containing protein [Selenomonas bovis]